MGEKLVIGPINKGLRTDRTAFVIDNDSFPMLINAYQWRGRVKRKRGTQLLGRLQRQITISITLDGGGEGHLLAGLGPTASIAPGSVTMTGPGGPFTDPTMDGYLTPTGTGGPNTIDYATGIVLIPSQPAGTYSVLLTYYPGLPVMGFEEAILNPANYPTYVAFDTTYAYSVSTNAPYPISDITFYSNPITGSYTGYFAKSEDTPFTWNGQNYQQFNTASYMSAMWATNGVRVPFVFDNVGMQFAPALTITFVSNTATTITVMITNCPLVIGDFVFFNEWVGSGSPDTTSVSLNFRSGYVTACSPNTTPLATKTITVTFPGANISVDTYTPGIIQYLTNTSTPTKDSIRFYDGNGWVNFMPPLSQAQYDISDEKFAQYYLVGAKLVYPYSNSLIFFGPVIQTSTGTPIYLPATAVFCLQNGTPYYTASFQGSPTSPTNITSILAPDNETAFPSNWFEDQTGFGGYVSVPLSQSIATVAPNSNALIVGFNPGTQTRFHNTGNSLTPFEFFLVNSELGSSSTFSTVTMDEGVITRGPRGFIMASQTEARRIDLDILQQPFDISNENNGTERFTAQRDFQNEWIYFTYLNKALSSYQSGFPNQTLLFNYRDNSWAIFNESYTTYGTFRAVTGYAWETIFTLWENLDTPWEDLNSDALEPVVVGGNQQGYLLFRASQIAGTSESVSLSIQSISGNAITSVTHGLNIDDYIQIINCTGSIAPYLNGRIFQVTEIVDLDTFRISGDIPDIASYFGLGEIVRFYVPFIQTKQFPLAWSDARKVRFGPQQYLLSYTPNSQITLLMFLSQDSSNAYNSGGVIPDRDTANNALIYSTVLYTCPESTNLGLTPANTNLQMPTASTQQQIWHRMNTSLLGDTVQLGFTLSDAQMMTYSQWGPVLTVTAITRANPCVVTCNNAIAVGSLVTITGVNGMTQINGGIYYVQAQTSTTVTLFLDASNFSPYVSGGSIYNVGSVFQTAEIELHSIILDVSQSSLLA